MVLGGLDFSGFPGIGRARCRVDATNQRLTEMVSTSSCQIGSPKLIEVKSVHLMALQKHQVNESRLYSHMLAPVQGPAQPIEARKKGMIDSGTCMNSQVKEKLEGRERSVPSLWTCFSCFLE